MAQLLVKRLLWRVSKTLTDAAPQFVRYAERDMVIAVQLAAKALCKHLPHAGTRTVAMRLLPGTRQSIARITAGNTLTLDGSTATDIYGISLVDVLRNKGDNGTTLGRAITLVDRQRLDRLDPLWHTRTGAVVRQYAYDPMDPLTFWVVPAVTGNVWVDVCLRALPKVIPDGGPAGSELYVYSGSSTETVGIDDQYEDELWNYACAYLLLSNAKAQGSLARAMAHAQAFNASVNTLAEQMTGTNPNLKQLPFAPEIAGGAS